MSEKRNKDNVIENKPLGDQPPITPRWVKISGLIAIVLVLVILILMIFGGGNHGPGRHFSTENIESQFSDGGGQG